MSVDTGGTVQTCRDPKTGWALIHHFLGQMLPVIGSLIREKTDEVGHRWNREIDDLRARFAGNLAFIIRRMQLHGFNEDAKYMQELFNFIAEHELKTFEEAAELRILHRNLRNKHVH